MRPRVITFMAAMVVVVGCGIPLRDFGQEPAPTPTRVTTFDDVLTAKLTSIEPLKRVRKRSVKGDINLAAPLNRMNVAWHAYLEQLRDGRLDTHPTPMKAMELQEGQSFGSVCKPGPNHRAPEMIQPLYCPDTHDEVPALMVLPPDFTKKVQAFAASNGNDAAWVLAAVLGGSMYAVHLRGEMKLVGVLWPDGAAFDYCIVGMSLRAVFPPSHGELQGGGITVVLAMLDQLTSVSDVPGQRLGMLKRGYEEGRLEECAA